MTPHRARFIAIVAPAAALPAFLFDQQRRKCEACSLLIVTKRRGMTCFGVREPRGRKSVPMLCLDVHTQGRCPV